LILKVVTKDKTATYNIDKSKSYTWFGDLMMLVKVKLSLTVVSTSVFAYLLASKGHVDYIGLVLLIFGGFFITGAANALNQVIEKDFDALMVRTADRPLATGRMKVSEAVLIAGLFSTTGIIMLSAFNPLTVLLGILALCTYAFIYTPLKRYSTIAVAVGAIPGALPVLIGFTAIENGLSVLGISLFIVQFLWQFPHFWSIGYLGYEDYQRAGYKLLPEDSKGDIDRKVGFYAMIYTLLIIPVIVYIWMENTSGIAMIVSIVMTLLFAISAWNFHLRFDRKSALKMMFASFFYMPLILLTYWLL